MIKSYLFILLLNYFKSTFCHNNCCGNSSEIKLLCEKLAIDSVPKCTNQSNLRELLLGYNDISKLLNVSFREFSNLITLRLNNNLISHIEDNAFENLNVLEILFLNHNLLESLPKDLFQNLKHLKVIYLHHNKFIIIPYIQSPSIKRIHLSNNNINSAEFPKEYLMCINLKSIELSHNAIRDILRKDLINLRKSQIETFKIKNNKLSINSSTDFYFIRKKLRHFVISGNVRLLNSGLKNIFNTFDHIRHTERWHLEIYANNVGLTDITINLFVSLDKIYLIKLHLTDNFIKNIESGFGNLVNLRQLDLSRNHLSKLLRAQFSGTPNLVQLFLKDNFIEIIDENAFDHLYELEILDLSNNRLEYLNTLMFVNLSSLHTLRLQGNPIVIISQCKESPALIINRFIVNNRLPFHSLCFLSQSCQDIIKDVIDFGFKVDISAPVCVVNTTMTSISTREEILTAEVGSNYTTMKQTNSTFESQIDISNENSSTSQGNTTDRVIKLLFSKLINSKMMTQYMDFSLIMVLGIILGSILLAIVIGLSYMFGIGKRRKELKRLKREIVQGNITVSSSNIYEALPEDDIRI